MQEAGSDSLDLGQFVNWLSRQREHDQGQLANLSRDVERLTLAMRDQSALIDALGEERTAHKALQPRQAVLEEQIRKLYDDLTLLQADVTGRTDALERQILARGAEVERDRRTLAELAQRVSELHRQGEMQAGKLQANAEDLKRDRASIAPLSQSLEDIDRRMLALTARIQQMEEQIRRISNQWTTYQEREETSRAELARLDNWQRMADVRWTRFLADHRQQTDVLRGELEQQGRPIEQLSRQATSLQELIDALQTRYDQQQKSAETQTVSLQRLEGSLINGREQRQRLEQTIDALKRRIEEYSTEIYRLEERHERELAMFSDLDDRLQEQRSLSADTRALLMQSMGQIREGADALAGLQLRFRERTNELEYHLSALQTRLQSHSRQVDERITDIAQLETAFLERWMQLLDEELQHLRILAVQPDRLVEADGDNT